MENIKLTKTIRTDFDGYSELIDVYSKIRRSPDIDIQLDFSNNDWFEANLCAVVGAMRQHFMGMDKTITLDGLTPRHTSIFLRNSFLTEFGEGKIDDSNNTVIPYRRFTHYQDVEFIEYIERELLTKPDFPELSVMLGKKIAISIFELFENARTHGQCLHIFTCGQYYPNRKKKRLDMTIVDLGVTIKANVIEYLGRELSGFEAIDWAMQEGNTTKTGTVSGGLGLAIILEFLNLNQGMIQIISSDGYWELRKGSLTKKLFEQSFPGTIVNIEFNLNDDCSYSLTEEVSLDRIF